MTMTSQTNGQATMRNRLSSNGIGSKIENNSNGYEIGVTVENTSVGCGACPECGVSHEHARLSTLGQLPLQDFFPVALELTSRIADLHAHGLIHKEISTNTIRIDPSSMTEQKTENMYNHSIQIRKSNLSCKMELSVSCMCNPERIGADLKFISPEQTGRMNRVVDTRTDLYSAGIVLFFCLTGRLPFHYEDENNQRKLDPMELVHAHIAVEPPRVTDYVQDTPTVLADIVTKCLQKDADQRYQSAVGLKRDLERAHQQYQTCGEIESFPLGEHDYSSRLSIPAKLYGRDEQVERVMGAFERVAAGGLEVLLVSGYSGVGKTSLVGVTHQPITVRQGYFIAGKFDQLRRLPYHAVVAALDGFVQLLLTKQEATLQQWKQRMQDAVGSEGRVLTDLVPALSLILGEQPPLTELAAKEAQNRFNYVLRNFFRVISRPEHPLVLFLDDLQWSDSGSLGLLRTLATDPKNCYLLIICAFRDNEVSPSHPFVKAVDEMERDEAVISKIQVENLCWDDVNHLVSDTFHTTSQESKELTDLVHEKTRGNSFFLRQFLRDLFEQGLVEFDWETVQWKWNAELIRGRGITDNVVDFMASKLKRLPTELQRAMQIASSVGAQFDLATVALTENYTIKQVTSYMEEAMMEGLIVPVDSDTFAFVHDRVQQAALSLTREDDRPALHYRIGRIVLESVQEEELHERIFDIVDQINWGIELVEDDSDRPLLAQLNLLAACKAEDSAAYVPAYKYAMAGIDLLGASAWEDHYELTLQLYTKAADTAYMSAHFDDMDDAISVVFEQAITLLDKLPSYRIRILSHKARNKLLDAIETGMEVLEQLETDIPEPTPENTAAELGNTLSLLEGKTKEDLLNLPTMEDPNKIAAMKILADFNSSAYWARPDLFPFIVFKSVELSVANGNTEVSSFAYGTFGVILSGVVGDMKRAFEFGELGIEVMEKYKAKEWLAQIYTPHYALIVPWNEHIRLTFKPLLESVHVGLETGAIEYATINANIYCIHGYLSGQPLVALEKEVEDYSAMMKNYKQDTNFNFNQIYHQAILNLQGQSSDPCRLVGSAYDEDEMLLTHLGANDNTASFFVYFNKMVLNFLFGKYDVAASCSVEAERRLSAILAKIENASFNFFDSLLSLALSRSSSSDARRKELLGRVEKNQTMMKKWAMDAPMNFLHKYDLVEAERARSTNKVQEAHECYQRAIAGAGENGYMNDEALANELAGEYFLHLKFDDMGDKYLNESFRVYQKWGAVAKMKHLAQGHPERALFHRNRALFYSSDEEPSGRLDMLSVMKSATAIQGEIVLSKLLEKLMQVVIENAGASRGCLMLAENGNLFLQAELHVGHSGTSTVLQGLHVQDLCTIPQSVVSYVARTLNPVVIANGVEDEIFGQDSYIMMAKPRSIHCSPIVLRGDLVAVVYLENSLVSDAFTEERTELLNLISGQIAISIHNALMYDKLDQKVRERTSQVERKKKKLEEEKNRSDELLLNILPRQTAEELKRDNKTQARRYANVTVLFSDICNFSQFSAKKSPEDLVSELDHYFGAIDEIITSYGLEKIKTIGDAYLAAGGVPVADPESPFKMISAAKDMLDFVEGMKRRRAEKGETYFDIRIGIHTGDVVAGVVGLRKFAYDIWGETVNIAARMESSGQPNNINISDSTYSIVKDRFQCTHRGRIAIKNMDARDMYFVDKTSRPVRFASILRQTSIRQEQLQTLLCEQQDDSLDLSKVLELS